MPLKARHGLPLHQAVLRRHYGLMAETLVFETNDQALLAAADASLGRFAVPQVGEPLVVRLFSEEGPSHARDSGAAAEARVLHRTHRGIYVVTHGEDVATVDVATGTGLGFVSRATADDTARVRYTFVEGMALNMLTSPARGYVAIHAAGVARDGTGIVLAGHAGAGKSTLAYACARRGLDLFAEDAVFLRATRRGLEMWGLPWVQRLLPDARELFPELAHLPALRQPNGERKLEVDIEVVHPGRAYPRARPGPVVLLERGRRTELEQVEPAAIEQSLEINWPWSDRWPAPLDNVARLLAEHGAYVLRMSGPPDEAADVLAGLLADLSAAAVRAAPA